MKKILFILLTSILFISCDNEANPVSLEDYEYKNNQSQFESIETVGDTIIAYTEGNYIYYKDNKNRLYKAYIDSNADIVHNSMLFNLISYILFVIVFIVIVAIIIEH